MGRTIPPAGDDKIVPFILGLTGQMGYVLGILRKLKMERDLALQELLTN